MIRLTLNAGSEPEIHLFNKSVISVGVESAPGDLTLANVDYSSIFLKIIEQNGSWIAINLLNDPFISLNGFSFGKKLLSSGDVILVRQQAILFENLSLNGKNPEFLNLSERANAPEEKIAEARLQPVGPIPFSIKTDDLLISRFPLDFENEVEAFGEEEWKSAGSLDLYVEEFFPKSAQDSPPLEENDLSLPPENQVSPPLKESIKERPEPTSLKDDYLRDLEDENQSSFDLSSEPNHLYQAWKWILLFIVSLLAVSGSVGTVIYYSVSDKTEAHVAKAVQGTADIAMALTHARLSRAEPHNQNWSDIDFLKTHLKNLLPDTSSFAADLDAHGQFNCCPYNLRIYTNGDLSRFLLIAQPAPTLLYWLVPKPIIILDSQLMELRLLKDVRNLNRLLTSPDPLDGANGKELTDLVKQGQVISLQSFAEEIRLPEFAPPRNIEDLQENAENLVYNAPRYYRLGQPIVQKAINLAASKSSSREVALLKQDIENIALLKYPVLYAMQGEASARQMRQGLKMFDPAQKIIFGYLLFNHQGQIMQVHLLSEEDDSNEYNAEIFSEIPESDNEIALQEHTRNNPPPETNASPDNVDYNHPIYIQLHALIKSREQDLKPLTVALSKYLNQELESPRPRFQIEFQNLLRDYLLLNAKHTDSLKNTVSLLYHQYEDLSAQDFFRFLEELHLDSLIHQEDDYLHILDENDPQDIEESIKRIEQAKNLTELESFVENIADRLNFDSVKDPQELIRYQTMLRNEVLSQLELLLLSPDKHLKANIEDREKLNAVLNKERLIKQEEKEFFLSEFDILLTDRTRTES